MLNEAYMLLFGGTTSGSGGGGGVTGTVEVIGSQISSGNSGFPNLIIEPQLLTDPYSSGTWTALNGTLADNVAAGPDGGTNASSLTETAATGNHYFKQSITKAASSLTYTLGVVAKQGIRTRIVLQAANNAGTSGTLAVFDLAGGQVGVAATNFGSGWTGSSPTITSLANGFYLCTLTVVTDATTVMTYYVQGDANAGTAALHNSYAGSTASASFFTAGNLIVNSVQTSNLLANLIDGTNTTWWDDYSPLAWAGVDMGVGKTANFTGYLFTPESGNAVLSFTDPYLDYPLQMTGAQFNQSPNAVQTSNDPTFASGVTTQDTLPTTGNFPRFTLHERDFSSAASRCARMYSPYGRMSQLFFLAQAGPTSARPCRPTISPGGGLYPAGSTTVTITSVTTSAAIYYTTDGTTPTNASTLYAGPFSLTIGGTVTLKAIAYDLTGTLSQQTSAVSSVVFTPSKITPLQDVYDSRGILVEAHGGSLIQVGSFIYWCGAMGNMYTNAPTIGVPRQDYGVRLYKCPSDESNPDYLLNWTYVGQILPQPSNAGKVWAWGQRPHIVFNANNNTYCLCMHVGDITGATAKCALASSSSIESGWSWVNTNFDPSGNGFRDCNFYTNAANTSAYLVYVGSSAGANLGMFITLMDSTFVGSAVSTKTVAASGTREAPVLFDNGTNLVLITSSSYGYTASGDADVEYVVCTGLDPIGGTWGSLTGGRVFNTNPATGNYLRSQPSFVFKPTGKAQYVLGCDLWFTDGSTIYSSRQAWSPMTITSTTVSATQPVSWAIGDLV